ncbi:hypothetical protein ACQRIU_001457 [Beauveria bassiana]
MAEYAANIAALIQISDGIIRVCRHFIQATKDAPRDLIIISGEVTSLKAILLCLSDTHLNPKTAGAVPSLFALDGPVSACYKSISELERLLPRLSSAELAGKGAFSLKHISWVLKDSQVRKLLADISLHKSTLLLALTGDLMYDVKDIKAGIGRVEQTLSESDRYETLRWLEAKCYSQAEIHNSMCRSHEEHTNHWLSRWDEWQAWLRLEQAPSLRSIWIHGIPGAGKSVLASSIVELLKADCSGNRARLGYSYYYCHYSHREDEGLPLLRWVVGQLSRQAAWASRQLKHIRDSGREPTVSDMLELMEQVLSQYDTVYVVVDGVDESDPRVQLLSVLTTLATDNRFNKVRLLSTSRLSPDIERALSSISTSISMSNHFVERDIRRVVKAWVSKSPQMARWRYLATYIEDKLCAGSDGMFRWVACQMQIIERIREETELLGALESLPRGIDNIYIRLLAAIPESDRLFVRQALLWIIGHASSVWLRDNGIYMDLLVSAVCNDLLSWTGKSYRYTAEDLQELCGCLITVKAEPLPFTDFLSTLRVDEVTGDVSWIHRYPEEQAPSGIFVKIAHRTVVDFLVSERIDATIAQFFSMTWTGVTNDFFKSVLRQALAANPASSSADWIRDREAYCLTLVPAMMPNPEKLDEAILDACVAYFLPTSPHYPRLRLIQYYLCGGCSFAQSYYLARLPVHHPGLPASEYQANDPYAWAMLDAQSLIDCFMNIFRIIDEAPSHALSCVLYERLVQQPQSEVQRICARWGVSFSKTMLDFKKPFGSSFIFSSDREEAIYKENTSGSFTTAEATSSIIPDVPPHNLLSNDEKEKLEEHLGRLYLCCWQDEVPRLRDVLLEKAWIGFDLDDTLHEFRKASSMATNEVLAIISRKYNIPMPALKQEYSRILQLKTANAFADGKTSFDYRKERFTLVLEHFSPPYDTHFMTLLLETYEATLSASLELKCGALGLLSTLRNMGKKIVVITEGPQDAQERTVEALGISSYIDFLATTNHFGVGKTAGLFTKVIQHLGISSGDMAYIGDNVQRDMEPALSDGIFSIHFAESKNVALNMVPPQINTLRKLQYIIAG